MVIRDERTAQEREMRSENTKLHRLLELINKYDNRHCRQDTFRKCKQ